MKTELNPLFGPHVVQKEIFHKEFNISGRDNLHELPDTPAVYGVFGIINATPVHARCVDATDNLREHVRQLFENPESGGLKKFMQENWVQMLCYELLPGSTEESRQEQKMRWIELYKPAVEDDGAYPVYQYVWPYEDDGITLKPQFASLHKRSIQQPQ